MIENPTAATPVEIDTRLAAIRNEQIAAMQVIASAAETLYYYAEGRSTSRRGTRPDYSLDEAIAKARENAASYYQSNIDREAERLTKARATIKRLTEESKPLNAEYQRRPWTRAFLVDNTNGHVHSSMDCSTCFYDRFDNVTGEFKPGTNYQWMTQYSGKDEAEIVADAGERACTVCYPSAPVGTLGRPTKMFTDTEITAAKAREERDQAKRDRLAKKIANGLTADGSEFVVKYTEPNAPQWTTNDQGQRVHTYGPATRTERFKTERAAVQWAVQYMAWGHRGDHMQAGFDQVIEAVATKHGKTVEAVRAEVDAKVEAKIKRDNR